MVVTTARAHRSRPLSRLGAVGLSMLGLLAPSVVPGRSAAGAAHAVTQLAVAKRTAKTTAKTTAKRSTKKTVRTKPRSSTTDTVAPTGQIVASSEAIAADIAPPTFERCAPSLECATVFLPLDYASPAGTKIAVFVSRRRADPATKTGTIFVNPGGPGGPSFDLMRTIDSVLPAEVLRRFDVVGIDPRGTQRSSPLACGDGGYTGRLDAPGSEIPAAQALAKACADSESARLAFIDTTSDARDMDVVRVLVGEPKISYLGFSYGSYLGTVYAALFPSKVRSMVLDSAIDPTRFGLTFPLDSFAALETALDGYLGACKARGPACAFNDGTDLAARYLAARARFIATSSTPIAAEQTFDGVVVTSLETPSAWNALAAWLVDVLTNPNPTIRTFDTSAFNTGGTIQAFDQLSSSVYLATVCRDGVYARDALTVEQVRARFAAAAPRFAGLAVQRSLLNAICPLWPVPPLAPVLAVPATAPMLVLANTLDTRTPLVWSQGLATALRSPILIRSGAGHIALGRSACVSAAVEAFFLTGAYPPAGTYC